VRHLKEKQNDQGSVPKMAYFITVRFEIIY